MLRNHRARRLGLSALIVALACAAGALTGCGHSAAVHVTHPSAKVVVIEKGHKHYKRCGHFKHRGKWYYSHGHVHEKYCGHKKKKGVWVLN